MSASNRSAIEVADDDDGMMAFPDDDPKPKVVMVAAATAAEADAVGMRRANNCRRLIATPFLFNASI